MRTKIILFTMIIFILLVGGLGCDKNEPRYEEIPLEYIECGQETRFIKHVPHKDVLLFDATKTSFDKMRELSFNGEHSLFISADWKNNEFFLFSVRTTMMGRGDICNFPNEIKNWQIPETGVIVSFAGDEFKLCNPPGGIGNNIYGALVLTSLKRKIQ